MKKNIKILLLSVILFCSNFSINADDKIFFIDMNYIYFNSKAGKDIAKKIQDDTKKINEELSNYEKKVDEQRVELLNQKNVITEEEFKKKTLDLGKKVKDYNIIISKKNDELNKYKNKANRNFMISLTKVAQEYALDNSIEMIIKKENVLIGKTNLDVTQNVLELFNKNVKKIKID